MKNTVLVLGAGTSIPYDYPSGATLVDQIAGTFDNYDPEGRTQVYDLEGYLVPQMEWLAYHLLLESAERIGLTIEDLHIFCNLLRQSRTTSIDWFLAQHDEKTTEVGKLLIAYHILKAQRGETKYPEEDDWMRYFIDFMLRQTDQHPSDGPIYVITFNYDNLLQRQLKHAYRTVGRTNPIQVVSVYGTIPITCKLDSEGMVESMSHFRTIYDTEEAKHIGQRLHDLIFQADVIAFLGFGYDDQNLERIGYADLKRARADYNPRQGLAVYPSHFGIAKGEWEDIKMRIAIKNGALLSVHHEPEWKSTESLRNWQVLQNAFRD